MLRNEFDRRIDLEKNLRNRKKIMPYYAVAIGRQTGIFTTWVECLTQVNEFPGSKFKNCKTLVEARRFIVENSKPKEKDNEPNAKHSKVADEGGENK